MTDADELVRRAAMKLDHAQIDVHDHIRQAGLGIGGARTREVLAKSVVPGITTSAEDYSSLAEYGHYGALRDYVVRMLLPPLIRGIWRIPFQVPASVQTTAAAAAWVGEGQPIPATSFAATGVKVPPRKVAAIAVVSKEMLRHGADSLLSRTLGNPVRAKVAETFTGSDAAVGTVSPAGIAAGATPLAASGTTEAAVRADLLQLVEDADGADVDLSQATWIMGPSRAVAIANALGLEGLGLGGGELYGAPVVTDRSAADRVLLIAGDRIALAIGELDIVSGESAGLELLDNPTNNVTTPTATNLVSLFQTDSVAFRCALTLNWAAPSGSVFLLDYGS